MNAFGTSVPCIRRVCKNNKNNHTLRRVQQNASNGAERQIDMADLRYRGSENKGESVKHDKETDDLVYRGSHHDPKEKDSKPKADEDADLVYRGNKSE